MRRVVVCGTASMQKPTTKWLSPTIFKPLFGSPCYKGSQYSWVHFGAPSYGNPQIKEQPKIEGPLCNPWCRSGGRARLLSRVECLQGRPRLWPCCWILGLPQDPSLTWRRRLAKKSNLLLGEFPLVETGVSCLTCPEPSYTVIPLGLS